MIQKPLAPQPHRHHVGHVQLVADIRRIEAAARVRVTVTHWREKRTHRVEAATADDAQAFRAAADRLQLDVRP